MKRAYLLNDWQTWEAMPHKPGREFSIVTESPYLFERLRSEGFELLPPSGFISTEERGLLADEALRLTRAVVGALDTAFQDEYKPVSFEQALKRNVYFLVSAALYRALQLERVLAAFDAVTLPFLDDETQNHADSAHAKLVSFHCNYFALTAEAIVREGVDLSGVSRIALSGTLESVSKIFNIRKSDVSARERGLLFGMRLSGQRNQLRARLAKAFGKLHPGAKATAYVRSETEFVRAHYPSLFVGGYRLLPLVLPATTGKVSDAPSPAWISSILEQALPGEVAVLAAPFWRAARCFFLERLSRHLSGDFLPFLSRVRLDVRAWFSENARPGDVVLFNGVFDAKDAALEHVLTAAGVPCVAIEHGAASLTGLDEVMEGYLTDKVNCSGFVAHYPHQEEFYRRLTSDAAKPFFVSGVRRRVLGGACETVARACGRRFLGISRQRTLALYAPTRFKDDLVLVSHESSDVAYWEFQRTLIHDVFARVSDADFFIKLHQKGWLPGQKALYDLRRHPLEILPLPTHIRWGTYPQLNYIRWASDVMLVDRATSTIQWALSSARPLIYMDVPFNPLLPEVREAVSKAVFYVDVSAADWTDRVRELLEMPLERLRRKWQDRASARKALLGRFILGPEIPGRAFVHWLEGLHGKAARGPESNAMSKEGTV